MSQMKKNNAITPREQDMGKWYTDVCLKAELMDYSRAKGFNISPLWICYLGKYTSLA